MLALLCTLVFSIAAALATGSIICNLIRYAPKARDTVHAARLVPDFREVTVRIVATPQMTPAPVWPQLRRQPRRATSRAAVRATGVQAGGVQAINGPRAAA